MQSEKPSSPELAETEPTSRIPTLPPQFVAGEVLGGRYRILEELGRGGEGVVLRAVDLKADVVVALKLLAHRASSESRLRRFRRELKMARKITHPGIVRIYDLIELPERFGLSMEWIDGEALDERIARTGPLGSKALVALALDLARAIAAAHAAGVTHRDLKPANILLRAENGRAVVADFGISRLHGLAAAPSDIEVAPPSARDSALVKLTREGAIVGTPLYMAPEQLRGRTDVGPATDVYAFGLVVFEAATGRLPHEGESVEARVKARLSSSATSLAAVRPDLPAAFCHVIARCLEKESAARYPSGRELRVALGEASLVPRRRWVRAGIAAAVLVGVTGAILGYRYARTANGTALCRGGAARLQAHWGTSAHDAVRAAFEQTGVAYAADALRTASRELDAYGSQLAGQSDDACMATRVRGEQSEAALDLRMACYETRWREFGAMIDLFRRADGETVREAARAVKSLSAVADCADLPALRSATPRPRDPALAAKVDAIDQRLAKVMASRALGKAAEAATAADELADEARRIGFLPLVARVDFWRGRALADLSEEDKSVPAFRAAFLEALEARDDRMLASAAARLAQEYIYALRPDDFDTWAAIAQAALNRSGPDPALQNILDNTRCIALYDRGKIVSRLACLERHAAKVEPVRPLDDWELTTLGLAAVDVGQYERGIDYVRRGHAYALAANGPAHPRTLEMSMYLGKAQIDAGDFAEGLATCRATLQELQRVARDNPALVGRDRLYTALALLGERRYDEARIELEAARGSDADRDDVLEAEATIDVRTGHAGRAVPHLRGVLADEERKLPASHPDVIEAKLQLGRALFENGDRVEARTVLDEAVASGTHAELNPMSQAELEFADARALWAAAPEQRPHALDLARDALAIYASHAPPTQGFAEARSAVERWIAGAR